MKMPLVVLLPAVVCAVLAADPFAAQSSPKTGPPRGQVRDSANVTRAPQSKPGTGSISGTVFILSSSQPLADATVTLYGSPFATRPITTTTDGRGRFTFTELPAARYVVGATKPGFANVTYGQRRYGAGGRPISLRDGENLNIELHVPPTSVITGTVVDERGNPLVNAQVRAFRFSMAFGYRRSIDVGTAMTDDRGVYRIHWLQPGEYAVCVATRATAALNEAQRVRAEIDRLRRSIAFNIGADREAIQREYAPRLAELEAQLPAYVEPISGYAPVCYPGKSSPAATIAVGPGDERTGMDFQLALVRLARLEGVVTGKRNGAREPDPIMLMHEEDWLNATNDSARPDLDGRFRFTNVPAGKYNLVLPGRAIGTAGPVRAWAMAEVVVAEQDVGDIVLHIQPGGTIAGRAVFEGTPTLPPSMLTSIEVRADPVETADWARYALVTANPDPDGRFTLSNLLPGRYQVSAYVKGPTDWFMESATVSGQDLLEQPLEVKAGQAVSGSVITFTNRPAELSGTILTENGEPASEYLLLVYPSNPKYRTRFFRRMYGARASQDSGRYVIKMLPGQYRLATLLDVEFGAWYDPAFFTSELDRAAVALSIGEREKKVHNIRVPGQP